MSLSAVQLPDGEYTLTARYSDPPDSATQANFSVENLFKLTASSSILPYGGSVSFDVVAPSCPEWRLVVDGDDCLLASGSGNRGGIPWDGTCNGSRVGSFPHTVQLKAGTRTDSAVIQVYGLGEPTPTPSATPTADPTGEPTGEPTDEPCPPGQICPTPGPTATQCPVGQVCPTPTPFPTATPTPRPTATPTPRPTPSGGCHGYDNGNGEKIGLQDKNCDKQPDIRLTKMYPTGQELSGLLIEGEVVGVDAGFDPETIKLDFENVDLGAQDLISFTRSTGEFKILIPFYSFTVEPEPLEVTVVNKFEATAYYKPAYGIASLPFGVLDYSPETFTLAFVIDYLPCGEIQDLCNPFSPNNHIAQQDKFVKTLHDTLKDYGMRSADGGDWLGIFAAGVIGFTLDITLPTSVAEILLNVYPPGKSVFKVVKAGSKSTVLRVTKENYSEFEKFLLSGVKDPSEAGYFFEALVKYIYKVEGRAVIIDEGREFTFFSNRLKQNLNGEIDFESATTLYELGISLKEKLPQLLKLAEYAKLTGKKVVVIGGKDKTKPGTIKEFQRQVDKLYPGIVSFELFDYVIR